MYLIMSCSLSVVHCTVHQRFLNQSIHNSVECSNPQLYWFFTFFYICNNTLPARPPCPPVPYLSRRVASHDCPIRYVTCHNGTAPDDGVISNAHAIRDAHRRAELGSVGSMEAWEEKSQCRDGS